MRGTEHTRFGSTVSSHRGVSAVAGSTTNPSFFPLRRLLLSIRTGSEAFFRSNNEGTGVLTSVTAASPVVDTSACAGTSSRLTAPGKDSTLDGVPVMKTLPRTPRASATCPDGAVARVDGFWAVVAVAAMRRTRSSAPSRSM